MHAPVAQWIERQPPELKAAGSNPAGRTKATPFSRLISLFKAAKPIDDLAINSLADRHLLNRQTVEKSMGS
jgi:hypothetical protein